MMMKKALKHKFIWNVNVIIASLIASLMGCFKKDSAPPLMMTPAEAFGQSRNDFAIIVDVREEDELKGGLAAPAVWMATSHYKANDAVWQQFVQKLPKDKTIAIYCAAGGRAGKIAADLAAQGFKTANIGGFKDWVAAGLPVKQQP
jgi:rhodanese-related sulfurtransferase